MPVLDTITSPGHSLIIMADQNVPEILSPNNNSNNNNDVISPIDGGGYDHNGWSNHHHHSNSQVTSSDITNDDDDGSHNDSSLSPFLVDDQHHKHQTQRLEPNHDHVDKDDCGGNDDGNTEPSPPNVEKAELDLKNLTTRLIERSSYRHQHNRNRHQHRHRDSFSNHKLDTSSSSSSLLLQNSTNQNSTTTTANELTTDKDYLEYIAKLQMDNLIPLKEDVADWLNRILNLNDNIINVENFMERLDNGVLVCKLIRVIEDHIICREDEENDNNNPFIPCTTTDNGKDSTTQAENSPNTNKQQQQSNGSQPFNSTTKGVITQSKPVVTLSRRCSLPNGNVSPFLTNRYSLTFNSPGLFSTHHQMKCWENAKSHTFFARDNVSNFLEWCRRFGVKDAVLFETEDLVSHVNQRNVVLCILEVARIACTKYSFSPAPGLVELEQEIDREIEQELQKEAEKLQRQSSKPNVPDKPARSIATNNNVRRKLWKDDERQEEDMDCIDSSIRKSINEMHKANPNKLVNAVDAASQTFPHCGDELEEENPLISVNNSGGNNEPSKDSVFVNTMHDVDSGCSYSSSNNSDHILQRSPSSNSVLSSTTTTSNHSSSSSVASAAYFGEDGHTSTSTCSSTPTPMTSELDHKVMQIAKTYYGKEARQGVQRLSEGKYKIANRIVFVRLLKARHVMVRVGGGWTTLSHFLARHGGDPNQQILPDELLPLDTKSSQIPNNNVGSMITPNRSANKLCRNGAGGSGSTTHTLVISTTTKTHQNQIKNHHDVTSSMQKLSMTQNYPTSPNPSKQSNGSFCNDPNIVRGQFIINSTPVSRRNSISSQTTADSPEPYSSTPTTTNNVPKTFPSSQTKIPVLRKRSRISLFKPQQNPIMSPMDNNSLLRSTSSITSFNTNDSSSVMKKQQPTCTAYQHQQRNTPQFGGKPSMIPRSSTEFGQLRRYTNYLRSSQHITNRIQQVNTSSGDGVNFSGSGEISSASTIRENRNTAVNPLINKPVPHTATS